MQASANIAATAVAPTFSSAARRVPTSARLQLTSIATATMVSATSSGSVIGVDCRYNTFGFSAYAAAAANAAAGDSVIAITSQAIPPAATANAAIEMATPDAPVR